MKMKRIRSLIVVSLLLATEVWPWDVGAREEDNDVVFTNLCAQARRVFMVGECDEEELARRFDSARHGGFLNELEDCQWGVFSNFCMAVSNSSESILQNWSRYSTNELVRFTILNGIAFSGECVYTNFVNRFVTDVPTRLVGSERPTVEYLLFPFGTPLEEHVAMTYDNPTISNVLCQASRYFEGCGETNLLNWCRQCLAGDMRQYYRENR